MKVGSKAIRCIECNKIIGWAIPNGRYTHGIKEVYYKFHDCANIVDYCGQRYYCDRCLSEAEPKYRSNSRKEKKIGRV